MADDSLEGVFHYAERAYIRMQAGDILMQCLDNASDAPLHHLVESLVIAGSKNLDIFKEILTETNKRKAEVEDDLRQVIDGLNKNLENHGVKLGQQRKLTSILHLRPSRLRSMMRSQGIVEEDIQKNCVQLLKDTRDLLVSLTAHLNLLEGMERYLADWLWVIYYQRAHDGPENKRPESSEYIL